MASARSVCSFLDDHFKKGLTPKLTHEPIGRYSGVHTPSIRNDIRVPRFAFCEGAADVKSHFRAAGARVLAISVWDDDDTKSLAKSLGAIQLLEKGKLYTELIPAIKQLHQGSLNE